MENIRRNQKESESASSRQFTQSPSLSVIGLDVPQAMPTSSSTQLNSYDSSLTQWSFNVHSRRRNRTTWTVEESVQVLHTAIRNVATFHRMKRERKTHLFFSLPEFVKLGKDRVSIRFRVENLRRLYRRQIAIFDKAKTMGKVYQPEVDGSTELFELLHQYEMLFYPMKSDPVRMIEGTRTEAHCFSAGNHPFPSTEPSVTKFDDSTIPTKVPKLEAEYELEETHSTFAITNANPQEQNINSSTPQTVIDLPTSTIPYKAHPSVLEDTSFKLPLDKEGFDDSLSSDPHPTQPEGFTGHQNVNSELLRELIEMKREEHRESKLMMQQQTIVLSSILDEMKTMTSCLGRITAQNEAILHELRRAK